MQIYFQHLAQNFLRNIITENQVYLIKKANQKIYVNRFFRV